MWKNLDTCKSFADLQQTKTPDIAALLSDANAASRVAQYSISMPFGMHYNYAAKQVDEAVLKNLQALADEQQLIAKYKLLLDGDEINT